ncbi:hypothetical protein FDECE_13194 [Fusarium decemcellulare]|nr:hypothetical protein FDECE_13194 [Fusarium decemcellulare]
MRFIHPSHHPPETLLGHLLEDMDLDFNYHPGLRATILEGLHDRAKRLLCDAHSWRAIVKVDHPEDPNFYQWRVDIIMVDMRNVENAKRYIATMRVQAFNTVPRTRSSQQPKPAPTVQVTLPVIQRPPPAPFQVASARQQSAHTPMPRPVAFSALPLRGHSGSTTRPVTTTWGRGNGYTVEQPIAQVPAQRFHQRVPFQGHGRRHTLAQGTTFSRRPPQGLGERDMRPSSSSSAALQPPYQSYTNARYGSSSPSNQSNVTVDPVALRLPALSPSPGLDGPLPSPRDLGILPGGTNPQKMPSPQPAEISPRTSFGSRDQPIDLTMEHRQR